MKAKPSLPAILYATCILSSLSLQGAILDDLFEKIETQTQTNHHTSRKKHHRHHHHTIRSKEAQWQRALQFLGYYHGPLDGDLATPASFGAITNFHTRNHQIATGFLEEEDKLYLSEIYRTIALETYLSYNGKNRTKNHQKLQAALACESFYHGKIDGHFGKNSKKALARYTQQADSNKTTGKTSQEIQEVLIGEAKKKVEVKLANIKKTPYDPDAYAQKMPQEDLLVE
jgi:hypothetical protein